MFHAGDTKEHYKMYKKGKTWLFAGIVTASLALGMAGSQTVQADTVSDNDSANNQQETTDQAATPEKSVTLQSATTTDTAADNGNTASNDKTPTTPETAVTEKSKTSESKTVQTPASTQKTEQTVTPEKVADTPATDDQAETVPVETPATPEKQTAVTTPLKAQTRAQMSQLAQTPTPAVTAAQPVATADETIDQWMPNKTLQQMVFKTFTVGNSYNNLLIAASGKQWQSASDITKEDMQLLNHLALQDYGTTYIDGKTSFSLEGLQYATNLTYLDLANDLDTAPHAMRGDITDLTPLQSLENLTFLQFAGNRVSDITPITGLKNITEISMVLNNIADFSSLNLAQYTKGWAINQQFIEGQLTYVPKTGSYTLVNPVKLPAGLTAMLDPIGGAVGIPVFAAGFSNATVRIFWKGADAALTGDNLTFSDIKDQITPGQTTNPWAAIYPNLVQEDYTYFLEANITYTGSDALPIATVVMPYVKADAAENVTVNYVDQKGKTLADAETLTGFIGEGYTAAAKEIKGYVLTEMPTNATGTFSDTAQTVTFVYQEATSTVTVHYQDAAGATIKPDDEVSGQVGTDYQIAYPAIAGYTYKETQGAANGIFSDTPTEVTFIYTKNAVTPPVVTPTQTVTVTVHYQTADGTRVAPDVTITGKAGDAYTTSPAASVPAGYVLVTTPNNASGTLGDADIMVTYIYEQQGSAGDKVTVPNVDKPVDKVAPTKPTGTPVTVHQGGAAATVKAGAQQQSPQLLAGKQNGNRTVSEPMQQQAASETLPQTDEQTTSAWWGVALLTALGGLVGIRRKKRA